MPEFPSGVWEPSAADLASLSAALTPCITNFSVWPHKTQTDALFSKTQIKEIDELLYGPESVDSQ